MAKQFKDFQEGIVRDNKIFRFRQFYNLIQIFPSSHCYHAITIFHLAQDVDLLSRA